MSILIIEDSNTYAKILQYKLRHFGKIEIVGTLSAARQKNLDNYDTIILDHLLPDGNSIDFLQTANTITPFIVLTGSSDKSIKEDVMRNGGFVYMKKEDDKFLESAIEMCIRHKKMIWSEVKLSAYKELAEINKKIKEMIKTNVV